jgi:DNA repair photolyase
MLLRPSSRKDPDYEPDPEFGEPAHPVERHAPPRSGPQAPPPKGRAAGFNTANRFEPMHLEPDALEPDDEAFRDRVPTQFMVDATKSILAENDSPDVGFRFSLNPYRGCEHGCIYCADGDTPILLADGTTRPLADVRAGDEIYGTCREGHYRRYTTTRVLAHWQVDKPAYRITLQDGTELTAAGDHRFLTLHGWKFVTGTEQGPSRRPHLTLHDSLLGTGHFEASPDLADSDYRRGYLTGLIRGDGLLATYSYSGRRRETDEQHHFRLALADLEALDRADTFLRHHGIETTRFEFTKATSDRRPMQALRTHARGRVDAIRGLISWPDSPSTAWSQGFLAGLFDAEGHYQGGILRISNTDPEIIGQTVRALCRLGLTCVVEHPASARDRPMQVVRLTGGLQQHLRFFHSVDPAIRRKRSIDGQALKSAAPTGVVAIEPIGRRELFDITTGTGDFIADGVVSHNCYARPTHEYLGFSAGLDFETKILVKPDAPDLLRAAFRKKSWEPQVVALSGNTDCYQPVERRLELTRRCLEVFLEFRNPVTIITKNALVTRDIDLLQQLADLELVHVTLSVTSLKPQLTGVLEPRTSRPAKRLDAIAALNEAGIPAGVNLAPLIPGLNDEEVPAILEAAAQHGAQWANYIMVRLPLAVKPLFLDWLQRTMPDRAGKIVSRLQAVRDGDVSDPRFQTRMRGEGELADTIARFFHLSKRRYGLDNRHYDLATHRFRRTGHHQLSLFEP